MRIAFAIGLAFCAATVCSASWGRGIDVGGDSSVPYEIRLSTFTADFIVKGTVESLEVAHAHLHAPVSFIGLRPQSFLKGSATCGPRCCHRVRRSRV